MIGDDLNNGQMNMKKMENKKQQLLICIFTI